MGIIPKMAQVMNWGVKQGIREMPDQAAGKRVKQAILVQLISQPVKLDVKEMKLQNPEQAINQDAKQEEQEKPEQVINHSVKQEETEMAEHVIS